MKTRLAWHPYLDPRVVEHDLAGAAVRDPIGHRVHLALALGFCFMLAWPTSLVDIAAAPLAVFSLIRLPNIWRTWGSLAVQPVFLGLAAWAAWQGVSLLWSADPRQGLREMEACRWIGAVWALWPVMMHRRWLIAAVAAGFVCGNLSQVAEALGREMGWEWVPWRRMPGRYSGWWDPVVGGSLLCGALGLHLPAALWGRGLWRWVGIAGAAVTACAIAATGTRGAWLAGAALVAGAGVVAAVAWLCHWRLERRGRARQCEPGPSPSRGRRSALRAAAAAMVIAAALAGAWVVLRGPVMARVERARKEIAAALERGDYATDTGARILMARWALVAMREHPVAGVGAGGFRAWVVERPGAGEPERGLVHVHAHSAPLHIGATLGAVGLGIAAAVLGCAVGAEVGRGRTGGRGSAAQAASGTDACGTDARGTDAGGTAPRGAAGCAYDLGPVFGLGGLVLAGAFDVVQLNAQTAALLAVLLGLCLASRPREWAGLRAPAGAVQ